METKKKAKSDDIIDDKEMKKTYNHVIDYILAKRMGRNGRTEYLVKWEGWHARDATWEPESNFASAQVAEIFEAGLGQQMGISDTQALSAKKKRQLDKAGATKAANKRKNNISCETFASKMIDKLKMKHKKKRRGRTKVQSEMISAAALFDVDQKLEKVIESYEKLVGASKRKSSRMSCPSSPSKPTKPIRQKSPTRRELRYKLREETKSPKQCTESNQSKTDVSNVNISGSFESNTSLEENKNPLSSVSFGEQTNIKTNTTEESNQ